MPEDRITSARNPRKSEGKSIYITPTSVDKTVAVSIWNKRLHLGQRSAGLSTATPV